MNLKLIAAPLFVLSLASTSALAAVQQSSADTMSTASSQAQQYSTMNNDAPAAKVDVNFLNNVKFGGYLAVDAYGQSDEYYLQNGSGANAANPKNSQSGVTLSAAAFNIADQVNNWVSADLNLFAASAGAHQPVGYVAEASPANGTYYYAGSSVRSGVDIDEAYINVANFAQAPVALRAGRFYLPFGEYDRYAMAPTLTQQLTETRATALEASYVSANGIHGAVYGFRGMAQKNNANSLANDNINTYGATVDYTATITNNLGADVGVGYISNMLDVGTIADGVANASTGLATYTDRKGGWDAYATALSGPFTLGIQYVSFASAIDTGDLAKKDTTQAKPVAGTVTGTYAFNVQGYATKLTADYGWTDDALIYNSTSSTVYTTLPKSRVGAEYDINVLPNTMVGAEAHYDSAYSDADGGTGRHSTTGTVRLAVML